MDKAFNNRILLIDDNEAVHKDIRDIFEFNKAHANQDLTNLENMLFDEAPASKEELTLPAFDFQSAFQGKEGIELVKKSLQEGKPYAVAVVDNRMPPGLDGIETIQQIMSIDADIQLIICTAYSDYSWKDTLKILGYTDRILIVKKPFDNEEIRLLVLSLAKKWFLNKEASYKREELEKIVQERTAELSNVLSLSEATLESTVDGILVVSDKNHITKFNNKFLEMWEVPAELIKSETADNLINFFSAQTLRPISVSLTVQDIMKGNYFGSFYEIQLKNDKIYELYISPQLQEQKTVGVVYSFRDISARKHLEEELAKQATHDNLTGLPNRILLTDRIQQAIAMAKAQSQYVIVLFIDMDGFKAINDNYGHQAGDELLKLFSQRLRLAVKESDTIARLGGDEFVVVTSCNTNDSNVIRGIVQKIYDPLVKPYTIVNKDFQITLSLGVSMYPENGDNPAHLIKAADTAMYWVKERGKNNFEIFSPTMLNETADRLEIEQRLPLALQNKEFELFYQPLVDINSKTITAMEALLRWNHPTLGLLEPARFINIAEETGIISAIGNWMLEEACKQNKAWHDKNLNKTRISVNISGIHFKEKNIVENIKDILQRTGMEPQYLEIELTETIILNNINEVIIKIKKLKELGVMIDIDDFGTGYSGLSYVNQFAINKIKIDQSFLKDISEKPESKAIIEAILMIAKSLNLNVLVEGVESEEHVNMLKEIAVVEGQGQYFSQPLPKEAAENLLTQGKLDNPSNGN